MEGVFYDSSSDEVKEAYIDWKDLKFKGKIDGTNDIEIVRRYLDNWTKNFLQDKKFEEIENYFKINI